MIKHKINFLKIALVFVLLFLIAMYLNKTDTVFKEPEVSLDAISFVNLLNDDNKSVSKDLIEKTVQIKGSIKEIVRKNDVESILITSKDESCIVCQMQNNQKEKLIKMKVGDTITVKGIFKGVLLNPILLQCILINN